MVKSLSICIPTYNRAGVLVELLESIVRDTPPGLRERLEICISDNASGDDTGDRVEAFAKASPVSVVYRRNATNLGADQNYLNAVALASGEYCWLMGSDDGIAPGLVEGVFARLGECRDVMLMDRVVCNHLMEPHHREHWLPAQTEERYFDFRTGPDGAAYLDMASGLGALFSFLSSIVVRRDSWNAVAFDRRYLGTAYSHAFILISVLLRSGIYYAPSLAVLNRSGNDSFLDQGAVNRVLLDYRGYLMLADDLLPAGDALRGHFLAVLARERPLLQYGVFLSAHSSPEQWAVARAYLQALGASPAGLRLLRVSSPVLGPAYDRFMALYRRLRYGRPG